MNMNLRNNISIKYSFNFLILFLIIISISNCFLQEEVCSREKPILKSDECQSIYCTPEEFDKNICKIANKYIKAQWLNNFHIFDKEYMEHVSVSKSPKGDLFLSSHKVSGDWDKYLFGFNSEGDGLFYNNETDSYSSFEKIDFPKSEYSDYNEYIEIDGNGYLISVPTEDDIFLIDYNNKKIRPFSIFPMSKSAYTIFKINGYDDMYFTAYTYCKNSFGKECYLYFQSFQLNLTLTSIKKVQNLTNIPTLTGNRINCFQTEIGHIFCFYTKNEGTEESPSMKHLLSLINQSSFKFEHTINIEDNYLVSPIFDETIKLRDNLFIKAYAIDENTIKILFKKIIINEFSSGGTLTYSDFFKNIPQIYINEDNKFNFKSGSFKRNDLYKINDNKFAILLKDFSKDTSVSTNSKIQIYIFTIFNNDQNINLRRYSIDFELYNTRARDEIRGYTLGDFFGIVLGLTLNRETYNGRATFMTFGYVNITEQEMYDVKLKYNNSDSKIILSEYINQMENNLFGYEFIGVKIIYLPSEKDAGYFITNITNEKIEIENIVDISSELKFILSNDFKEDIYSIIFAGLVEEPSYEKMNEFAEELVEYPLNGSVSEKDFYEPKRLMGRKMNYKFRLSKCYDSCSTCKELSLDENNQQCIKCRKGFYFKEGTNNCYDKIDTKYYFDEDKHMFSPCYKDCLTCSYKEINSKQMNCLSCDNNFNFYNTSKNCLNCSKYVNYEQTECIETIPDGYYLEDKELGILEKCYYLCKTCTEGHYYRNNDLHMNCKSCLYNNSEFSPRFYGDCPETPDDAGDDEVPIDGKCSFNKPIYKEGLCQLIYCTPEEYKNKICTILNPILKEQWLNNFHTFSKESASSICLASDIISNEKVIFLAQSQEFGYTYKYLYGFYNNGSGIFYDENKNKFNTFKQLSFPVSNKLIENLAQVEIDSNEYLLTTPQEDFLNIINYKSDSKIEQKIDYSAYSSDKIILRQNKTLFKNPEYLVDFIYCKNNNLENCYIMMKNFEANERLNELNSLVSSVQVHYNTNLNCYKDENNYIKCIYLLINEDLSISNVLGIFSAFTNKDIELVKEIELEKNYNENPSFYSMIEWSNNIYIIGYSSPDDKNIIKIILKKIFNDISPNVFRIDDYISSIPSIIINKNLTYNFAKGEAKQNALFKLSDEKFVMLVKNYKDDKSPDLIVYVFNVYSYYSKINVRDYPIHFTLYNTLIDGKIIGYNLNGFLGVLIELSNVNEDEKRATFFTFGYVNTTNDISPMEGYDILFNKKEKLTIKNYFGEIENNLFGYKIENIKIISVPDEKTAGYFSLNNQYNKLNIGDLITLEASIGFYPVDEPMTGNYSLVLAALIKEPEYYQNMNSYCQNLESYPLDEKDTEIRYYEPKKFLGKHFSFNFFMKGSEAACFDNCETCSEPSKNINNQKCIKCKNNYYKIYETNNCFEANIDGYYLDENSQILMPCYKNCFNCSIGGNSIQMNCNSCKSYFNFYEKSKNCLKCEKFVNYEQTECINEVPEGYYIYDEKLGIIEKCHELCKTCQKGSSIIDGNIHMNCNICKYNNNKYKPIIEGNCPDKEGGEDDEEEEEKNNEEEKKKEEEEVDKDDDNESSSYIWILYTSIVVISIVIIGIIILKYLKIKKNSDYSNLEKKGQNISMEDTSDIGLIPN